jgi:aminoglycoside phosphotransferase (APT) family kinase protein
MLTIDARLEIFKKNFPFEKIKTVQERQGKDFSILEINHAFMCKSAYDEQGAAALAQETKILMKLQGKFTTQIPAPLYYQENFLVYKKINGSPLFSYMINHLGNKQRTKLMNDVAQFLVELHHALSEQEVQDLGIQAASSPWSLEVLQDRKEYFEDKKEVGEVFDSALKIYQEALQTKTPVLLHNNFDVKNVIVDSLTGQLRGVIDFTDVAYDDYALDLRLRRYAPADYSKAVAIMYNINGGSACTAEKLYGYYFAAEFTAYFKAIDVQDQEQAQAILQDILRVVQTLAGAHTECKEKGSCMHAQQHNQVSQQISAE